MPWRRNPNLAKKGYFHVFNRGVEKRQIFMGDEDCSVFLKLVPFYIYGAKKRGGGEVGGRYKGKISILCYCLIPNHFHLLLRQDIEGSTSGFMHDLCTAYVLYFNRKYGRVGPLFQSRFVSKAIEDDASLLNISRYIHRNPDPLGKLRINLAGYKWNSYSDYLGGGGCLVVSTEDILSMYNKEKAHAMYRDFVEDEGYGVSRSPAYV